METDGDKSTTTAKSQTVIIADNLYNDTIKMTSKT